MKQVAPAYLVGGDEPILRREALDKLLASLLGDDDPSLALAEFTIQGRAGESAVDERSGSDEVGAAHNALLTPPFGSTRRIVVVHDAGALTASAAAPLVGYLADPAPDAVLVVVAGGGTMPTALAAAIKKAGGEEIKASSAVETVLREHLKAAEVHLEPDAVALATERLGDDPGRVPAVVDTLYSVFGSDARLGADQIEPYLGEPGMPAPYLLTNAIDAGDVAGALDLLERLRTATGTRQAKPMHWLQIMGLLHSHYRRLLRLDTPAIVTDDEAVAALGGRTKPYAAKKAREQSRRLGTERLRSAIDALAQADLDLRGASGVPEVAVIEVLVVRLAGLSRAAGAGGGSTGRSSRSRAGTARRGY